MGVWKGLFLHQVCRRAQKPLRDKSQGFCKFLPLCPVKETMAEAVPVLESRRKHHLLFRVFFLQTLGMWGPGGVSEIRANPPAPNSGFLCPPQD